MKRALYLFEVGFRCVLLDGQFRHRHFVILRGLDRWSGLGLFLVEQDAATGLEFEQPNKLHIEVPDPERLVGGVQANASLQQDAGSGHV